MDQIKAAPVTNNNRNLQFRRVLVNITSGFSTAHTGISMGGNEGGRSGQDRWNFFRMHPVVQKSPTDPGSDSTIFDSSLQSHFGLQKSTTVNSFKIQENLMIENPTNFESPKVELEDTKGKKTMNHKLKHRDMNILTPSGF